VARKPVGPCPLRHQATGLRGNRDAARRGPSPRTRGAAEHSRLGRLRRRPRRFRRAPVATLHRCRVTNRREPSIHQRNHDMSNQRLLLTEEQRALIGTVRSLAKDKDFRGNSIKYLDGTYPWDNLNALAKIGILGMSIPEEYGGSNLPVFDTALVMEEVAKHCYNT